jgi:acyl-coenzyme A thioesterase PaaI-like protein
MRSRLLRYAFNFHPAYRGSGGRVKFIAHDFREIRVRIPLSWRTRNYVGTIFGGSMFAAVDPMYMIMLMKNLGEGFVVWDKSASVRFRKPGRSDLNARFVVTQEQLDSIRDEVSPGRSAERSWEIELVDEEGNVCASVEKRIHISLKR